MPYQAELATVGTQEGLKATAAEAADPERSFTNNLCWNHYNGCAGDIRLYHEARVNGLRSLARSHLRTGLGAAPPCRSTRVRCPRPTSPAS